MCALELPKAQQELLGHTASCQAAGTHRSHHITVSWGSERYWGCALRAKQGGQVASPGSIPEELLREAKTPQTTACTAEAKNQQEKNHVKQLQNRRAA